MFKVGQEIEGILGSELPVGTVLAPTGERGFMSYIKLPSGEWLHIRPGCVVSGGLANDWGYQIAFLPASYEADPVEELAEELWQVRHKTVTDVLLVEGAKTWHQVNEDIRTVYRTLARHVLDREKTTAAEQPPGTVIDGWGGTWTLQSNGKYTCRDIFESYTLEDIDRLFGLHDD